MGLASEGITRGMRRSTSITIGSDTRGEGSVRDSSILCAQPLQRTVRSATPRSMRKYHESKLGSVHNASRPLRCVRTGAAGMIERSKEKDILG